METMQELERAFLKAHTSGDRQTAATYAREIKRRRSAGSWFEQGKAGLVEGVAAIPGLIGDTQKLIGDTVKSGAEYLGAEPDTADTAAAVARRWFFFPMDQAPTTQDIVGAAQNVVGELPAYEEGTTGQKYLRSVGRIAPSAAIGPGRLATKVASGVGAGLGSEAAGQMAEGTKYETAARIGGAIAGGVGGGGVGQALTQPRAPYSGIPAGAQQRVAQGLAEEFQGNIDAALARGDALGPDAMVMNLGARPAGQAITIARQPTQGMATIKGAINDQRSRATSRVEADWNAAVGPAVSRFGNRLQKAEAQAGTKDVYEIARGRPVDPSPVQTAIMQARQAAGNDRVTRSAVDEIAEMMRDPLTGRLVRAQNGKLVRDPSTASLVREAGGLVNARQAIDTKIREIGTRLTNNPADDVYELGSRTTTGRQLMALRRAINETLHQDDALRQADVTFAGAERVSQAYERGRTKVIGSGDNVIEPEALRAWLDNPRVTLAEKEAFLRGISQRGLQNLRDIRPNRNEGAAFGNSVATPNNLSRLREAAGPQAAERVQNMAKREDLFARDASRATANSVTSDVMMGAQEFPSPGVNANYANASQVTLPGAVSALAMWAANKATGGMISRQRTAIAEGAAKLLTAKGEERGKVVRELMGYAAKLDKQDPGRALIMRALLLSRNASGWAVEDARGNRYDAQGRRVQ